ncbi:coumaroyl-CoA:anthocyanidin 3-O-glucoside-6''-O-coumaroyltransferase 1-like [Gastrolobium bilobum]|uniref:coumaroyl-CoA:anthocyanidin 3-O-glucoside-6''-O-coumaroyltransferase 1-like n=1 Tax=Gastrolobium bilobum TaxID=150636 RepID=UPI002AAFB01C|nr:coumaroyl-CoA:anthocyanidin 3-O-glucoside-6''-O-coumaroyltransferase 1-like [Gastrolobium bilobum]
MAEEVKHHNMVKVIDQCQVSPPSSSVPSTSIPLSFLDIPWLSCTLIKKIFFYEFPYSTQHFLQTVVPILKHSLSLTLQRFFPLAANVAFTRKPHTPHILYSEGDFVSFTVAESTADFTSLVVSDSPRDVRDAYPLVPVHPSSRTLEDGTLLLQTMAIQVTVFANSGFSICLSFRHEIADGRAFDHFMKFWATVCRSKGDFTSLEGSLPMPLHKRDIIEDPKGLKPIFLETKWNLPRESIEHTSLVHDAPSDDMVRHRFILSRNQLEKLKKWIAFKCQSIGVETLHLSTFVVTCSLVWVCIVKSEDTNIDNVPNNNDDYYCCLGFAADCRNFPEFSIPSYFGNCLSAGLAALMRSKLLGENGIFEAASAIGNKVRDVQGDPMKGVEAFGLAKEKVALNVERVFKIAGSPKIYAYETDFGWGKPKLYEILHADDGETICLSDCRDEEGGVEVGVAFKGIQMKKFNAILEDQLRNIAIPYSAVNSA